MAHGGKREGAGRKPGSITTKARETAEKASAEGVTPLEYMLKVLRSDDASEADRRWAAEKAAPYVHARLSAVDVTADVDVRDSATKEQRDAAVAAALRADT